MYWLMQTTHQQISGYFPSQSHNQPFFPYTTLANYVVRACRFKVCDKHLLHCARNKNPHFHCLLCMKKHSFKTTIVWHHERNMTMTKSRKSFFMEHFKKVIAQLNIVHTTQVSYDSLYVRRVIANGFVQYMQYRSPVDLWLFHSFFHDITFKCHDVMLLIIFQLSFEFELNFYREWNWFLLNDSDSERIRMKFIGCDL